MRQGKRKKEKADIETKCPLRHPKFTITPPSPPSSEACKFSVFHRMHNFMFASLHESSSSVQWYIDEQSL